jgi:hypothetical protein
VRRTATPSQPQSQPALGDPEILPLFFIGIMEVTATSVSTRIPQLRIAPGEITTSGGYEISNRATAMVCSNLSDCQQPAMFEDSMLLQPPVSDKTDSFRERHYSIVCPDTLSIARLFVPEDRPLLEVPRSTGNHPKKRQPVYPGLPLVSFISHEAGCLRTKLRVSSQTRLHSTFASLPKLHATTFQKASTHDSHPDCFC